MDKACSLPSFSTIGDDKHFDNKMARQRYFSTFTDKKEFTVCAADKFANRFEDCVKYLNNKRR